MEKLEKQYKQIESKICDENTHFRFIVKFERFLDKEMKNGTKAGVFSITLESWETREKIKMFQGTFLYVKNNKNGSYFVSLNTKAFTDANGMTRYTNPYQWSKEFCYQIGEELNRLMKEEHHCMEEVATQIKEKLAEIEKEEDWGL